ncbi:Breast cancer type 1 susceptibility protein homolog [Anthophora plagiata]
MEQVFATADKLSEVIGDMQNCLQCTICLNTISDPMITPCGHRFCRECIQTVLQNKNTTCPLCNTTINRRNIYTDEHIRVYIDRLNNLIQAIKLDSGIDVLADFTRPRGTRESCSSDNTERWKLNVEEQIKPSCSHVNTSLPMKQYANRANKNTQRIEKKESKNQKSKKKGEMRESNVITKHLSKYGLSGVEPLPSNESNNLQERNSMEEKVHSWLNSLPNNVPLDSPNRITPLQPVDGNLDDTLTISVSQIANNKMEMFDVDAVPIPESIDQSNVQDCKHSSRSSLYNENNENVLDRKKEHRNSPERRNEKRHVSSAELSTNNRKIFMSGGTKVNEDKERSDERSSDVPRTSTCNMLPTMKQNWSSVAQFGKEMRTKRKKLKTLNVSIENIGKARSPDKLPLNKSESVGLQWTEDTVERSKRRRRSAEESKETENVAKIPPRKETFFEKEESLANVGQETELPSGERGDRSMPSIFQPLTESSFVRLNQASQIRIPSFDNSQMNEDLRNEKITNDLAKNLLERRAEFEREESLANVNQETELPSGERGDRSMPSIFEPVGGSSFVRSNQNAQNRNPSLDNSQMNEDLRNERITNDLAKDLLERRAEMKMAGSLATIGQETGVPSVERGDRSMPSIFEPVGESSFVRSNQSTQNRNPSLDNSQINENLRNERITNDLGKNLLKTYVELFETSLENRSKTPTPTYSNGFHPLQADLVNESSSNRNISSLTPAKMIEKTDESCSASKLQASPLNRSRLSLKRRATDPKADDSSCTNADSRLQAVRRDLNHQIDQSCEGNADARKASTVEIIGHEENSSSRSGERDERVVGDLGAATNVFTSKKRENRELNGSLVTFKKLGKVYKLGKKRVRFLYLGTTRRMTLLGHSYAGHNLQKLHNTVDVLEQTRVSQNGFGNDVYITVNDTPTLKEQDNNPPMTEMSKQATVKTPSVSKADSNRFVDQEQTTVQKNLNTIVDSDTARFESTDMLVVSLDEVQPTQLLTKRSTKSPKKTATGIKMLSPTKDSQLRFLLLNSPTVSCTQPDSLQTKKLIHRSKLVKDDDLPKRSSFSEIRGAHSRALIRTSQQASTSSNSPVTTYPKKKRTINHEQLSEKTERKSERTIESDDSDHSLSSQATCVRNSQKETPSIDKNNEPCRSSSHNTKDIEAVSLNSDTDVVPSGRRKLHRKPLLLDSSNDSPEILCVNTVNELTVVSPSSKRKRPVSPDSENEVDLIEIASNWYADAKSGERCKKKGKVDKSDETSNSINMAKENVSFDHNKLADRLSGNRQNRPRAKLLGVSMSEKSNFAGNNWRQTVEESRLFDEDSPDFAATIDKMKDIRNRVIGESNGRVETVRDECLLQDNFDDIMANVDTDALVDEYCNDRRNKRDVECLEESDRDSNSETSVVSVRRLNRDVLHVQRSNKCKKSIVLIDSDDENQKTLVPEYVDSTKSFRKDELREKVEPKDDGLAVNKSIVNDKDSYDSLMNITQHYLMIKQFEEDLFEKCKNSDTSTKKQSENTELQTPRRMKNDAKRADKNEKDVEHSGEEDDIVENTPDTKTKSITHTFSSPRESTALSPIARITEEQSTVRASTSTTRRSYASDVNSPTCKRSIHPLYQSTPKAQQSISKNNHRSTKKLISNLNESTSNRQTNSTPKSNLVQSVSNVNKQKFCFVCSGLVSSQIENVKKLAQMVNAKYLTQFDRDVTHVIVKTDKENNGANKTLKYLQGVAYGKWIVSYQWVMDTLKERRLISEKLYEAVDGRTLEAGPRKSRLRENHLFEGFTFLCIGPYDDVTVEQYQDLLRATGGIVVDSLDALAAEKKRWKIIVIQADIYDYEAIIEWYKQTQAVPIVHDWIVECISRYKLISFYPYLQELSRQNVLNLGYPEFLIEEEPDEDFDNTADTST